MVPNYKHKPKIIIWISFEPKASWDGCQGSSVWWEVCFSDLKYDLVDCYRPLYTCQLLLCVAWLQDLRQLHTPANTSRVTSACLRKRGREHEKQMCWQGVTQPLAVLTPESIWALDPSSLSESCAHWHCGRQYGQPSFREGTKKSWSES